MFDKYAGSRALEVLRRRLEVQTTLQDSVVTVGITPTLVVRSNPRRLLLLLVNHGGAAVRIAPSPDMVESYGIVISGNGGSLTLVLDEALEAVTTVWYGEAVGVACPVYVLEVVAQ